jgi:hypothetical protein
MKSSQIVGFWNTYFRCGAQNLDGSIGDFVLISEAKCLLPQKRASICKHLSTNSAGHAAFSTFSEPDRKASKSRAVVRKIPNHVQLVDRLEFLFSNPRSGVLGAQVMFHRQTKKSRPRKSGGLLPVSKHFWLSNDALN